MSDQSLKIIHHSLKKFLVTSIILQWIFVLALLAVCGSFSAVNLVIWIALGGTAVWFFFSKFSSIVGTIERCAETLGKQSKSLSFLSRIGSQLRKDGIQSLERLGSDAKGSQPWIANFCDLLICGIEPVNAVGLALRARDNEEPWLQDILKGHISEYLRGIAFQHAVQFLGSVLFFCALTGSHLSSLYLFFYVAAISGVFVIGGRISEEKLIFGLKISCDSIVQREEKVKFAQEVYLHGIVAGVGVDDFVASLEDKITEGATTQARSGDQPRE